MSLATKSMAALILSGLIIYAMGVSVGKSIDVKVTGKIDPLGCTPAISNSASFDYGEIDASDLEEDGYKKLRDNENNNPSLSFSLMCYALTKVAFRAIDSRKHTVVLPVGRSLHTVIVKRGDANILGLGTTEGKNIVGYRVSLTQLKADGEDIKSYLIPSDEGKTWESSSILWLNPDSSFSSVGTDQKTPLAVTNLSGRIKISGALNKNSELKLKTVINLDGLFTIQLVYL